MAEEDFYGDGLDKMAGGEFSMNDMDTVNHKMDPMNYTGMGNYGDLGGLGDTDPEYNFDHNKFGGDSNYNFDDDYGFGKPTLFQRFQRLLNDHQYLVWTVLILLAVAPYLRFGWDNIQTWWKRRKAATRYKRMKKADVGGEMEMAAADDAESDPGDEPSFFEVLCASVTSDKTVTCTIVDQCYDSKPRKIDVAAGSLEKVTELPFLLQEACRGSGIGELAALSLVDLWLKQRAQLQYTSASGANVLFDKTTTVTQLRRAKSFRVTILPPNQR